MSRRSTAEWRRQAGVVMRQVRDALCLSPPLVITRDEIDELVARVTLAVDATSREIGLAAS